MNRGMIVIMAAVALLASGLARRLRRATGCGRDWPGRAAHGRPRSSKAAPGCRDKAFLVSASKATRPLTAASAIQLMPRRLRAILG